ncbi:MAG: hypothetical protein K1X39_04130 [Thermoflexales bacterium]|nr:hypothetical protein [Thermoflexales bacterium]
MPRRPRNSEALFDDAADGDDYIPPVLRRRRIRRLGILPSMLLGGFVTLAVALGLALFLQGRQEDDAFCVSCHTAPHTAYRARAEAALGGAYALDLSAYHYQQIRGTGGAIHCIDCHRGDASAGARADVLALGAQITLAWLAGESDPRIEKTTITATQVVSREGGLISLSPPVLLRPGLINDACVSCHMDRLLVAGQANHMHNMLPATYALWKSGKTLTAPAGEKDPQALLARGLARYTTSLQCASCHTGHQSMEVERYLDAALIAKRCAACHAETGVTVR